jgi:hypothetical protein
VVGVAEGDGSVLAARRVMLVPVGPNQAAGAFAFVFVFVAAHQGWGRRLLLRRRLLKEVLGLLPTMKAVGPLAPPAVRAAMVAVVAAAAWMGRMVMVVVVMPTSRRRRRRERTWGPLLSFVLRKLLRLLGRDRRGVDGGRMGQRSCMRTGCAGGSPCVLVE